MLPQQILQFTRPTISSLPSQQDPAFPRDLIALLPSMLSSFPRDLIALLPSMLLSSLSSSPHLPELDHQSSLDSQEATRSQQQTLSTTYILSQVAVRHSFLFFSSTSPRIATQPYYEHHHQSNLPYSSCTLNLVTANRGCGPLLVHRNFETKLDQNNS